ncbi:MAG: hemolysin family protein [Dietzia sp.]|uniref:Hemolysin family protein n=1 Tax=Dietzia cercidiphylli TaxID=498199 RepID=A0ABN2ILA2_9ACTN|nr:MULTISPECIES: hemolysin family protein [Dietzia]MBB1038439.1 HlyC/CorC family transporter [Dietzia natronolimnaea]MBB1054778.1 HlyC/CorC family transporter [Dietzia sp. B44]MBB1056902.1 HlyC/CorC family transporter [Dietzia sp. B19]MBB1046690.1 HlyC/CorC family transporter [Dietzia cercidiphylli]MBC7297264.1 HlyC/CorC family transporter [Dietzia sp.]
MDQTILTTGAAVLLILVAGVFAALDAALSTVSVARVEEMAKEPRYGAARLSLMLLNRPRYINVTVLLHLLSLIAGVVLLTVVFAEVIESTVWALVGVIAVTTIAAYVVAGVGPRTLGRQHAYSLALGASTPMRVLGMVLGPVASLLVGVGNAVTPGRGFRNGPFASEIELLEIVDMARERGVVADDESRMIQSVFELGDTTAREVMTPRTEMVWIESDKTVGQAARLTVKSGYSRIPVVDGDNSDDVVGVIYLRDIVARLDDPDGRAAPVADVMRPAVFVPDAKRIDDLLSEMQRDHNHLAILVDEYGGTAGLVSIEDILEEIVGEIVDEYDTTEVPPVEELEDGRYRLSSRLGLDEVAELFDVEFPDEVTEEVETIGGLMALELGRVPLPGAHVVTEGLDLRAEGGHDRRGRVRVVTVVAERIDLAADGTHENDDEENR